VPDALLHLPEVERQKARAEDDSGHGHEHAGTQGAKAQRPGAQEGVQVPVGRGLEARTDQRGAGEARAPVGHLQPVQLVGQQSAGARRHGSQDQRFEEPR
jgi:hypothetical protein